MNLMTSRRAPLALALTMLLGCGDDDDTNPDVGVTVDSGTPDTGPQADAGVEPDAGPTAAAYAVTTEIGSGENYTSYLVITDDLSADQELSLDQALELPGRSRGVGPSGRGNVFVFGDEAPTLTKYTLGANDELVAGDSIDFSVRGVASLSEYQSQFQFITDDKAYFFDPGTAQAIVWNPEAMEIRGAIDLSGLERADHLLFFSQTVAHRRDNYLFYPAGWITADRTGVLGESAVVVVNTDDDTAEVVVTDRCGWARDGVVGPDDMLYLATESYAGAAHHLDDSRAGEPCLVRFDLAQRAYDESFLLTLDAIVNPAEEGDIAGMLMPAGNREAYLQVLDTNLVEPPPVPIVVAVRPYWSWWRVTLGDTPVATPVEDGPEAAGGRKLLLDVGDALIMPVVATEPARTTLHDLGRGLPDGQGPSVQGTVFSLTKLR